MATAAAFLFTADTAAQPHIVQPKLECSFVTAKAFRPFSRAVWKQSRWKRGMPKKTTLAAYRRKLQCAAGPGHLRAIRHRWGTDKRRYFKHRKAKREEARERRERLRYLPYECGGGTRSAIPCSIMWCESGGSYTAANPTSTAYGKYQMLDSTYAAWCRACDWSPADQDRAAYELYASAGGAPWVCS